MSGSKKNQKTTTSPWSGQQPFLTDIFNQAQNLYQGGGPQYYGGQTNAQFDPYQRQGIQNMAQRGAGGSAYQDAAGNYVTQQLNQQNVNPQAFAQYAQQAAGGVGQGQQMLQAGGQPVDFGQASGMAGLGGAFGNVGLGEAQQFAGQPAMGALPSSQQYAQQTMATPGGGAVDQAAQQQLQQTAGGDFLGANPYLDQAFNAGSAGITKQFEESVLPSIAAQFGAAGRTGSGAQALTTGRAAEGVTRQLADLAGKTYAPAYENERNRQIQAAGSLGNLGLGGGQLQLGAAGLGGDLFSQQNQAELGRNQLGANLFLGSGQQNLGQRSLAADLFTGGQQRQLQGGQAMGQLGMQGVNSLNDMYKNIGQSQFRAGSLAPSLQQMDYQDINSLIGAGGMNQQQNQSNINADMQRWNYEQNLPWQNLGQYSNMINQLPGGLGTRTGPPTSGSRGAGALGGAMSGAATGATIGSAVPVIGTGIGALAGGVLGGFGGYFA